MKLREKMAFITAMALFAGTQAAFVSAAEEEVQKTLFLKKVQKLLILQIQQIPDMKDLTIRKTGEHLPVRLMKKTEQSTVVRYSDRSKTREEFTTMYGRTEIHTPVLPVMNLRILMFQIL